VDIEARPIRVAYTVEQCWHPSPGGTAIAALRIARELAARPDDVELHLVAGKHPLAPVPNSGPPDRWRCCRSPVPAVRSLDSAQLAQGRIGHR
jgi:hypothetical protein